MDSVAVVILIVTFIQLGNAALTPADAVFEISRFRRQATESEISRCSNVLLQAQCSTTNYIQNIVNELSQCGSAGSAFVSATEGLCRKNPSTGDYCGSLLSNSIASIITIPQICGASCSDECRSNLTSLLNQAGCCVVSNIVINALFSQFFTICQITVPSACPPSSLTIPSTSGSAESCTLENVQALLLQTRCSRSNIQPLQDALTSANCGDFATSLEAECSFRNGRFCSEQISESTASFTSAVTACRSMSSCPNECQTQINNLNNNLGCCINSVNASFRLDTSNTLASFRTITSNELWTACGVTPPGQCEVRLSAAASLSYKVSAILVAFTATMIKFL